jgi:aromatic ring hydroxylase
VVATFPHEKDFVNKDTKDLLLKYTKRSPNMSVEDQAQFWRYLSDVLCSTHGAVANVGAYHGGGSPVMEQIAITTQYDMEARKKLVRYIAGMSQGDREVLAPKAAKTKSAPKTGKGRKPGSKK